MKKLVIRHPGKKYKNSFINIGKIPSPLFLSLFEKIKTGNKVE